jgi:hypothetical protein
MNSELLKQALAKVLDPHVLINLVSSRVRQLNSGGGRSSRALLADTGNLGVIDIALLEIIENKMGFDAPEIIPLARPTEKNRNRPQGWGKAQQAVKTSVTVAHKQKELMSP